MTLRYTKSLWPEYRFPQHVINKALKVIKDYMARDSRPYSYRTILKDFIVKGEGTIIGSAPALAVPTLNIRVDGSRWRLQPKCKRNNGATWRYLWRKHSKSCKIWGRIEDCKIVGCDFHEGNVGKWRGRAVIFDW